MLALLDKIRFWLGAFLFVGAFATYSYLFDDSRRGHPKYNQSEAYQRCIQIADNLRREKLADATANPSLWQEAGYSSPSDYAGNLYRTRSHCD